MKHIAPLTRPDSSSGPVKAQAQDIGTSATIQQALGVVALLGLFALSDSIIKPAKSGVLSQLQ